MGGRIRNHLRSNVVGYIALFFVLTGGTAYALDGSNTVFSDDIVNGEVKAADLGTDSVTSSRIVRAGGNPESDVIRRPVSMRPPSDSRCRARPSAMAWEPPRAIGHPTRWARSASDLRTKSMFMPKGTRSSPKPRAKSATPTPC